MNGPATIRRRPDPGRAPASSGRSALGFGLVVFGAALLFIVGAASLASFVTRTRALAELREAAADPTSRALAAPDPGAIVGRITAPRIGLDAVILEGLGRLELLQGAGHDPSSALPGENGNVVIAAHRDMHFRPLRDLQVGDSLHVETVRGAFTYAVRTIEIVDPERGDLAAPTSDERLTLVTCYPFHWIGPAPRRFVVQAVPASVSQVAMAIEAPALEVAAHPPFPEHGDPDAPSEPTGAPLADSPVH